MQNLYDLVFFQIILESEILLYPSNWKWTKNDCLFYHL